MKKLLTTAALGVAVSFAVASMASAETVAIKLSDLNLSNASQAQVLAHRVKQASHRICSDSVSHNDLDRMAACEAGIRVEVQEKLAKVDSSVKLAYNGR